MIPKSGNRFSEKDHAQTKSWTMIPIQLQLDRIMVKGAVDADRFEQARGGLRCPFVAVISRTTAYPE
jgi:hypothetical protein